MDETSATFRDCPDGWVPLNEAAAEMGYRDPESLRIRVHAGDFTRLRKTPGRTAAIFIPREEVDAFKAGGLDAVRAMRAAKATAVGGGA